MPLLTREERKELTEEIVNLMIDRGIFTISQLALFFRKTRSQICNVVVSLRTEGMIEPFATCSMNPGDPEEIAWGVTAHGQYHGDPELRAGMLQGANIIPDQKCRHCQRYFQEWL